MYHQGRHTGSCAWKSVRLGLPAVKFLLSEQEVLHFHFALHPAHPVSWSWVRENSKRVFPSGRCVGESERPGSCPSGKVELKCDLALGMCVGKRQRVVGGDYRNRWRFTAGIQEFKAPGESDLALAWRKVEAERQPRQRRWGDRLRTSKCQQKNLVWCLELSVP